MEDKVYFIGAVNLKGSNAEKLNLFYMAAYYQMPGARDFWELHNMLSQEEKYEDIKNDILLVPFSEESCRTEQDRENFQRMKEEMFRREKGEGNVT